MIIKKYIKSRQVAKVTFELPRTEIPEGVEVESAHLVGEFNDWDPTVTAMKYSRKKEAFWVAVDLEPGREYQFRYLLNGEQWCNEWDADAYVQNSFGEDNCVVVTPDQNEQMAE